MGAQERSPWAFGLWSLTSNVFFTMEGIDGSLGSKLIPITGFEVDFCLITLLRASFLGTFLALSIAELMKAGLYSLDSSKSFNSEKCFLRQGSMEYYCWHVLGGMNSVKDTDFYLFLFYIGLSLFYHSKFYKKCQEMAGILLAYNHSKGFQCLGVLCGTWWIWWWDGCCWNMCKDCNEPV